MKRSIHYFYVHMYCSNPLPSVVTFGMVFAFGMVLASGMVLAFGVVLALDKVLAFGVKHSDNTEK